MSELRLYLPGELGGDGYPPEWHATIKHAVRDAAGHRCIRCGHPYRRGEHGNGEWSPCDAQCTHPVKEHNGGPTYIAVDGSAPYNIARGGSDPARHHDRVSVKQGATWAQWRILTVHHLDGDKANCRWWNLAALCQRCHLTIQGKVVMDRRWHHEHSPWFRPYVAGYYAWRYLDEDITRDEAERRIDELLALEHRQLALGGAS